MADSCERPGERGVVGMGCGDRLSAGLLAFQAGLLTLMLLDDMTAVALAGAARGAGAGVTDTDALAELAAAR